MIRTLLLLLAGSSLLAQPLFAQESPEASSAASSASNLAKGLFTLKDKMWECDMHLKADGSIAGEDDGGINGKMHFAFGGGKMFAMTANVELPESEFGGGSLDISLVSDGKELFIQQEGMGQPAQAFKVQWSLVDQLLNADAGMLPEEAGAAMAMFGMGADGEGVNPTAIDSMMAAAGMKQVKTNDGVIRLTMVDDEDWLDEGEEPSEVVIDIDPKTFFPKHIKVSASEGSGETGGMELAISGLKFHAKKEGFGEKAFTYTAPEGMFVMDVTPMLEMQLQAASGGFGGAEEELEF